MADRRMAGNAIRRRQGDPSSHLSMAEGDKPAPTHTGPEPEHQGGKPDINPDQFKGKRGTQQPDWHGRPGGRLDPGVFAD